LEELKEELEKMIETKGIDNDEVLSLSQKLDLAILEYYMENSTVHN